MYTISLSTNWPVLRIQRVYTIQELKELCESIIYKYNITTPANIFYDKTSIIYIHIYLLNSLHPQAKCFFWPLTSVTSTLELQSWFMHKTQCLSLSEAKIWAKWFKSSSIHGQFGSLTSKCVLNLWAKDLVHASYKPFHSCKSLCQGKFLHWWPSYSLDKCDTMTDTPSCDCMLPSIFHGA